MTINDSVYGKIEFDFLVEKIINTQVMQRLKNIHQNGAMFLAYPEIKTSRFEHSLGVCHLIKILGGDKQEQIAGLLHDLSHTAFSHVIDYVIDNQGEDFHEQHKLHFLTDRELSKTLHSIGLESENFLEDEPFHILEAKHPELCADRIDYTLRDLIAWGKISPQEVQQFVNSLVFVEEKIMIKSIFWGQWFKDNYTYLNQYVFQNPEYVFVNNLFCQILKQALSINVIQIEDFFNDDRFIIDKITSHPVLKDNFNEIHNRLKQFKTDNNQFSATKFKQRYIDPLIFNNNRVTKLSECI